MPNEASQAAVPSTQLPKEGRDEIETKAGRVGSDQNLTTPNPLTFCQVRTSLSAPFASSIMKAPKPAKATLKSRNTHWLTGRLVLRTTSDTGQVGRQNKGVGKDLLPALTTCSDGNAIDKYYGRSQEEGTSNEKMRNFITGKAFLLALPPGSWQRSD
jgi:hypothetical protein